MIDRNNFKVLCYDNACDLERIGVNNNYYSKPFRTSQYYEVNTAYSLATFMISITC